jgi:hypothetical protein
MGKKRECPVCSIDIEPDWSFCPNCDYWFGEAKDIDDSSDDDDDDEDDEY